MFGLPEAKRVRREDLRGGEDSASSDGEVDAEVQARLNAQIAKSLGLDVDAEPTTRRAPSHEEPVEDGAEGEGEEEGYAFRLFSTAGPAPKVVLEDPRDQGDGGLVRRRPLSHYVAGAPSAELRGQYEFAAVTGDEVVARSRVRRWGLEMPWRVTTIRVVRRAAAEADKDEVGRGRKRPGKRRRIAMRTRERAKVQAKELAERREADKEEHLREKRKRMNRLKKLRKRAKKKGDGGGDDGDGDDTDGS